MIPSLRVVAHGLAGRADLPVPLSYFVIAAGLALVLSFVMLAVLWKEPRWQGPLDLIRLTRPLPKLGLVLRLIGLAGLAFVVVAGLVNGHSRDSLLSPVMVWIVFWLVIPFLSMVLGGWWFHLNPWRTIASWWNEAVPERPERAARLGLWPATLVFVSFAWVELALPTNTEPPTLALAAVSYTFYIVAITRLLGVETGLASGEAFEVYNTLVSDIAPATLASSEAPGAAVRAAAPGLFRVGWLRSLPNAPARAGLAAFVVAMIGTVTFDGLSDTQWWSRNFRSVESDVWFQTAALISIVILIGAGYFLASLAAARLAGGAMTAGVVARSFAHTLVPIAVAYAFAHYFTLVIFEGQRFLHELSDPFGYGWNLFGTADWKVSFWLSANSVWYLQTAAIVLGHVAGVVLAHDRALTVFPKENAVKTQYAMLLLMIGLTALGLGILSGS